MVVAVVGKGDLEARPVVLKRQTVGDVAEVTVALLEGVGLLSCT
jgi:hypothetical protein